MFTACDPMEDVYEELDKANTKDNTTVETVLVKADYDLYKDSTDYPHVAKKQYFIDEAEAAELVPAILNKRYSHLGNGATVTVTYNRLSTPGISNEVSSWVEHTVTSEEYVANGDTRGDNFNSSKDFESFLKRKYPNAVEGQLVVLTYNYFAGTVYENITDSFFFKDGSWKNIYHVTDRDYISVNSLYKNFTSSNNSMLPTYFDKFLKEEVLDAEAGDIMYVSYYYYDFTNYNHKVMAMIYDGEKWVKAEGSVETATLKFKKKNNKWEPDLSISYKLVAEDYVWMSQQPELGTPAQLGNIGVGKNDEGYNRNTNFYQQDPTAARYWKDQDIYNAISALLKHKYPNTEVGTKYAVTYEFYNSGVKAATVVLELMESGEYEVVE